MRPIVRVTLIIALMIVSTSTFAQSLSDLYNAAHYSRVQETEADEYGYQFLKKGGYSPMGMIDALEKLHSIEKDTSNKYVRYALTLFSSHPDIVKRIEHLCDIANEDGYTCKE